LIISFLFKFLHRWFVGSLVPLTHELSADRSVTEVLSAPLTHELFLSNPERTFQKSDQPPQNASVHFAWTREFHSGLALGLCSTGGHGHPMIQDLRIINRVVLIGCVTVQCAIPSEHSIAYSSNPARDCPLPGRIDLILESELRRSNPPHLRPLEHGRAMTVKNDGKSEMTLSWSFSGSVILRESLTFRVNHNPLTQHRDVPRQTWPTEAEKNALSGSRRPRRIVDCAEKAIGFTSCHFFLL
jgi:hypothetical protein